MRKLKKAANKKKNKQHITYGCTRYTYDAWMKCYPDSTYEEWYAVTCPDNLMDFYYGLLDNMKVEEPDFDVKIVTLDEEYFIWLGDRENTEKTRELYAQEIQTEEATRLLKKNNMDKISGLYFVPAIYFSEKDGETISLKVSDKIKKKIKSGIERTVPASVYVPGIVISSINLSNYTEDDYSFIYETVVKEETKSHDILSLRRTNPKGIASVDFMPIKVTHLADSSIIHPDDYAIPENKGFSIFSSSWDIFSNKEIAEQNDSGTVIIDPLVYDSDELPEAYEEITKSLISATENMIDQEDMDIQGYA